MTKKEIEVAKTNFFQQLLGSRLGSLATTLVIYVDEVKKPDGERLEGYHESGLESLRFRLFSPAPIYSDLEEASLAGLLQMSSRSWARTIRSSKQC